MRWITNIRFPLPSSHLDQEKSWNICLDNANIIRSIKPDRIDSNIDFSDWDRDWLSPMGVDLQINGGLGIAFNDLSFQHLPKIFEILDLLWNNGVEAICPTVVTSSLGSLRNSLEVLKEARKLESRQSCKLLGAHLEGPFLSKKFHGAHDLGHILEPSKLALEQRIGGFESEIALVTLAPELDGASEIIEYLKRKKILVSLGHSAATAEESELAFAQGISMITHAFNAMNGIHHRSPGPIGQVMRHEKVMVGLIADGVHVHPNIAFMLHKLLAKQIFLVSDALPAYGTDQSEFFWNDQLLVVKEGACRLKNGKLAGSTLSLLEGCKRLAKWTGDPSSAIWSATISPRYALDQGKSIEDFLIGKPLRELLRWRFQKDSTDLVWTRAE